MTTWWSWPRSGSAYPSGMTSIDHAAAPAKDAPTQPAASGDDEVDALLAALPGVAEA